MNTLLDQGETAFREVPAFRLEKHVVADRVLFYEKDAESLEVALLAAIEKLPIGGLLPIDFSGVLVSSSAARQLLRRALRRLLGGEFDDRYVVLSNAEDSLYNLRVMLESESLVAVVRQGGLAIELVGSVDQVARDTFAFLLSMPSATASMVFEHFKLANISTATNRLTNLARLKIVRRTGPRPVVGGGREYLFAPVR